MTGLHKAHFSIGFLFIWGAATVNRHCPPNFAFIQCMNNCGNTYISNLLYTLRPGDCSCVQTSNVEEIKDKNKTVMLFLKQFKPQRHLCCFIVLLKNAAGFAEEKYQYCKTSFTRAKRTYFMLHRVIGSCTT